MDEDKIYVSLDESSLQDIKEFIRESLAESISYSLSIEDNSSIEDIDPAFSSQHDVLEYMVDKTRSAKTVTPSITPGWGASISVKPIRKSNVLSDRVKPVDTTGHLTDILPIIYKGGSKR